MQCILKRKGDRSSDILTRPLFTTWRYAVLQQDGAHYHTSNATQKFLQDELGPQYFW